jgi:hypothetical protein
LVRLASRAVLGVVDQAGVAGKLVGELPRAGIRPVDVSVAAKPANLDSTAAASRGKGALGPLGKSAAWLVDARQIDRADLGPVAAAGPLGEVLASSPSTSLVGALVMQGIPQHDAVTYLDAFQAGKVLVLVGVADRTVGERVRALFERNGVQTVAYYSGRPYGTAFHGTGPGLR